jgi:hypothetical protein
MVDMRRQSSQWLVSSISWTADSHSLFSTLLIALIIAFSEPLIKNESAGIWHELRKSHLHSHIGPRSVSCSCDSVYMYYTAHILRSI